MSTLYKFLIAGFTAISIVACSSDSTSLASLPSALKGTVATGSAIAANITIVDADGKTYTTTSGANGKYAIDMLGAIGPYLIKSEPTDTSLATLYSYATGPGTANATQFTSLGLVLATTGNLETIFTNWETNASSIKRSDIEEAVAIINANLATELEAAGQDPEIFDIFTVDFNADGTGVDAFLDDYSIDIDYSADSFTIMESSGTEVTINENIDISGYYIGALFALDPNTNWVISTSLAINGQTIPLFDEFPINDESVPLSRSAFIEDMWGDIGEQIDGSFSDESGSFAITVSNYTPTYTTTGTGGVGTTIVAGMSFAYKIVGTVNGQAINQSVSYSWTLTYKRVS